MFILMRYIKRWQSIFMQSKMSTSHIYEAKKVVLFLLPPKSIKSGGILSIFGLAKASRTLLNDAQVVFATFPGKDTYAKVDWFDNDENIYRFSQIVNDKISAKDIIIHIPEYLAGKFVGRLSRRQKEILKSIPALQINILNQNIDLMPSREMLEGLFELTPTVTQTTAHDRYATQEICDKWKMPLHHLSTKLGTPACAPLEFNKKKEDKIIALSPDKNPYRERIIDVIKKDLPDYRMITVKDMTYEEYFSLLAKSMFVITFGEGFDGYFIQPFSKRSIGLSVYNDTFFPSKDWLLLDNVYSSYEEMSENIVDDIRRMENDEAIYSNVISKNREEILKVYSHKKTDNNLARFYKGEYDFYPSK